MGEENILPPLERYRQHNCCCRSSANIFIIRNNNNVRWVIINIYINLDVLCYHHQQMLDATLAEWSKAPHSRCFLPRSRLIIAVLRSAGSNPAGGRIDFVSIWTFDSDLLCIIIIVRLCIDAESLINCFLS